MNHDKMTLIAGSMKALTVPTNDFSSVLPPAGTLAMLDQGLAISRGSSFDLVLDLSEPLYTFTKQVFKTDVTGRTGPTLSQLRAYYTGTSFVSDTTLFNSSAGIQIWTVPATGRYRIEAIGATKYSFINGGGTDRRPIVEGTFDLLKGDKLRILVGQMAGSSPDAGAGGSFVESEKLGLLVVGGGQGGIATTNVGITTTGKAGPRRNNAGTRYESTATLGRAGTTNALYLNNAYGAGCGGAGYEGSVFSETLNRVYYTIVITGAKSFKEGGIGGRAQTSGSRDAIVTPADGGFGGGGAAAGGKDPTAVGANIPQVVGYAGGGGYTGGDGSPGSIANLNGGGGGDGGNFIASFALAPSVTLRAASSTPRSGSVTVTLVALT